MARLDVAATANVSRAPAPSIHSNEYVLLPLILRHGRDLAREEAGRNVLSFSKSVRIACVPRKENHP